MLRFAKDVVVIGNRVHNSELLGVTQGSARKKMVGSIFKFFSGLTDGIEAERGKNGVFRKHK